MLLADGMAAVDLTPQHRFEESAIDLTPPALKLAALSDEADAARKERQIGREVELRHQCYALTHLVCRDDEVQLANAAAELAAAYQRAGSISAAARHAAHAEGLLSSSSSASSAIGKGRRRPDAHELPLQASVLLTLGCAQAAGNEYARALETFPRAVAASHRAYGPTDPRLSSLLRECARMLARAGGDHTTAEALLLRARELQLPARCGTAPPTASPSAAVAGGGGGGDMRLAELDQERAVMMLQHAKQLDARADLLRRGGAEAAEAAGAAGAVGGGTAGAGSARVAGASKAVGTTGGGGGGGGGAESEAGRAAYRVAPGFVQRPSQRHGASNAPPTSSRPQRGAPNNNNGGGGGGPMKHFLTGGGGAAAALAASAAAVAACTSPAELSALATRKRREAAAILGGDGDGDEGESGGGGESGSGGESGGESGESGESGGESGGGGGSAAAAAAAAPSAATSAVASAVASAAGLGAVTATEARLATQLAEAYKEMGWWKRAEAAYLRALPYYEKEDGVGGSRCLQLWGELAAIRMQRGAYALATRDFAHVATMTELVHGDTSTELIPPLERLCKACVLARRWQPARDALSRALAISRERLGPAHRDTARIQQVLGNLQRYAKPASGPDFNKP